jgi:hypothetical protein
MSEHRGWHHADENERRNWQNPEVVLKEAGLKPGITLNQVGDVDSEIYL